MCVCVCVCVGGCVFGRLILRYRGFKCDLDWFLVHFLNCRCIFLYDEKLVTWKDGAVWVVPELTFMILGTVQSIER